MTAQMKKYNPSTYGLTLQRIICEHYGLDINEWAQGQFDSNYDEDYANELSPIVEKIEKIAGSKPYKLMTFTTEYVNNKQTRSPHNFKLKNGKTLSIRTTKGSGMVAPRVIGQAGFKIINKYFSEIFGREVETQEELRGEIYKNIHQLMPIFIECFFPSDYNIIVERSQIPGQLPKITLYKLSDIADYSFNREEFSFTRGLDEWVESNTLKYHGISIVEIQTHKNRSFKFRFKIKAIPEWFRLVKTTTETFGITAESAVCENFGLEQPDSFKTRVSAKMRKELAPVISAAFEIIPMAVRHTGSESGRRGGASKSSFDFELDGGQTLSLKTNIGNKVCPPEVGQPGADTCLLYFKKFFPEGVKTVTNDIFKQMVLDKVDSLIPVYLSHLFDSDWLLWIYKTSDNYKFEAIHRSEISETFHWQLDKFSFTKPSIKEWKESNTVKYDGLTIGEFQVHNHRKCFKFRFHMPNILMLLRKQDGRRLNP